MTNQSKIVTAEDLCSFLIKLNQTHDLATIPVAFLEVVLTDFRNPRHVVTPAITKHIGLKSVRRIKDDGIETNIETDQVLLIGVLPEVD